MAITAAEKAKIRELIARLYSRGYSEGMGQTASRYGMETLIPKVSANMSEPLNIRLGLVDKMLDEYLKKLEAKGQALKDKGQTGAELVANLTQEARTLAENKAEIISEGEFAQAKLDGAGNIMSESGVVHQWRFSHFDLGTAHNECAICRAIRIGGPYTTEQAEKEGFPRYPHPHCDHGWIIVPQGEMPKAEEFPTKPEWERFGAKGKAAASGGAT